MTAPVEDPRVLEYRLATVNRMIDRALDDKDRKAFAKARGVADAAADQARQDRRLMTKSSDESGQLKIIVGRASGHRDP
jgi:hypothetical protein